MAVLAPFLGGATERWAQGIILSILGLLLIFDPPRRSLGLGLNVIALTCLILPWLAFLPETFFSASPWREALVHDYGVALGPFHTPQPWLTLEAIVLFYAGLAWTYYCFASPELPQSKFDSARFYLLGVLLIAGLSIFLFHTHRVISFWHSLYGFGPFPNRNQTANLFALTAILIFAFAYEDFRKGSPWWFFWVLGLGVLGVALVENYSRAGILLFFGGAVLWLIWLGFQSRSARKVALFASLLLILLTLFLIYGGKSLNRFVRPDSVENLPSGLRLALMHDAWKMIESRPIAGVGLGNFESVFPFYREYSKSRDRAIHPESDWMWLMSEMGLPAGIAIFAGVILLLARTWPMHRGTERRLRAAAAVVGIGFALHGLADVSGHRLGSFIPAIFIFSLCAAPLHVLSWEDEPRLVILSSRLLGTILLLAGVVWVGNSLSDWKIPGRIEVDRAYAKGTKALDSGNIQDAWRANTQALQWAPLDWRFYFQRATTEAWGDSRPGRAQHDFRIARYLEPFSPSVPFQEGLVWKKRNPDLALTAWEEALNRAGDRSQQVYSDMMGAAAEMPWHDRALELGRKQAGLKIDYLSRLSPSLFREKLAQFLEDSGSVGLLGSEERQQILKLWSEKGESTTLLAFLHLHPDWKEGWPWLAREAADSGDFHQAYQIAIANMPAPILPALTSDKSLDFLTKDFNEHPDDVARTYLLYLVQARLSKWDDALATVQHVTLRPGAPDYWHYLAADLWAKKGDWAKAWEEISSLSQKVN